MYDLENAKRNAPRTARSDNFDRVFNLIKERFGDNGVNLVETGSIRFVRDSGDGHSTAVWKSYVEEFGGHVWTCNINREHLDACVEVTKNSDKITYHFGDSIQFLKEFEGNIHLAYLDSFDSDAELNCAVHQVQEAQAVLKNIHPNGLIMLDDVGGSDGSGWGKAAFSIQFLKANGWNSIYYNGNQMILSK